MSYFAVNCIGFLLLFAAIVRRMVKSCVVGREFLHILA